MRDVSSRKIRFNLPHALLPLLTTASAISILLNKNTYFNRLFLNVFNYITSIAVKIMQKKNVQKISMKNENMGIF